MYFNNKTILITGASSGIGKAIVEELRNIECNLIFIARRKELLVEIVDQSTDAKAHLYPIKCDISDKQEVSSVHSKIISQFGKIDIAILNAGYAERMEVENYDSKLAETIFGANVFGLIYWIELLLPDMLKRREGLIAGVSSLADNRGYSRSGFYSASKAAATIYLEGLRVELKPYNVKVLTVRPGFVKTPMTDKNEFSMPFLMEPKKAAKKILDGIKKEKPMIQFPWQIVVITRLIQILPNWLIEFGEKIKLRNTIPKNSGNL